MTLFKTAPLIIGENSALYGSQQEQKILQGTKDIAPLLPTQPLDILIDFPGAQYTSLSYPKLSYFEMKQALQNHPAFQDKTAIATSACLTKKGNLTLCTLHNSERLTHWLEALTKCHVPIRSVKPFAFSQGLHIQQDDTKATYWISATHDQRARHMCLLKGAILFVRYTAVTENILHEIQKTLHFIQRDYGLERSDITLQNDLDNDFTTEKSKKQNHPRHNKRHNRSLKILHWTFLENLPPLLLQAMSKCHSTHRLTFATKWLRRTSSLFLILSASFLTHHTLEYYRAQATQTSVTHALKNLPMPLQGLSLEQLQHLLWIARHQDTPFGVIDKLHRQHHISIKLEEFYWKGNAEKGPHLQIAIRQMNNLQQPHDLEIFLKQLFKRTVRLLSSDKVAHRFDISLRTSKIQ